MSTYASRLASINRRILALEARLAGVSRPIQDTIQLRIRERDALLQGAMTKLTGFKPGQRIAVEVSGKIQKGVVEHFHVWPPVGLGAMPRVPTVADEVSMTVRLITGPNDYLRTVRTVEGECRVEMRSQLLHG